MQRWTTGGVGGEGKRKRKVHWAPDVVDKRKRSDDDEDEDGDGDAPRLMGVRRIAAEGKPGGWGCIEKTTTDVVKKDVGPQRSLKDYADLKKKLRSRRIQLGLNGSPLLDPPKEYLRLSRGTNTFELSDDAVSGASRFAVNQSEISKSDGEKSVASKVKLHPYLCSGASAGGKTTGLSGLSKKTLGQTEDVEAVPKEFNVVDPKPDGESSCVPEIRHGSAKEPKPIPDLITRLFGESKSFTMEPLATAFQGRELDGTLTGTAEEDHSGVLSEDKMEVCLPDDEFPPVPVFKTGFIDPNDSLKILTRGARYLP